MLLRVLAVFSGGGTFLETPKDELAQGNTLSVLEGRRVYLHSCEPVNLLVATGTFFIE